MLEDRGGGWRLQQQACTCVHVPEQADGQEGFSLVESGAMQPDWGKCQFCGN